MFAHHFDTTFHKIHTRLFVSDVIRGTDLLEQIPTLAIKITEYASRYPVLSDVVSRHLVPIVVRNLSKSDSVVRNVARSALLTMLEQGSLSREEAEYTVCPIVLAMSRVESMMDLNTSAITVG